MTREAVFTVAGLAIGGVAFAFSMEGCGGGSGGGPTLTKAALGRLLFFDTTLSNPVGEACATCHDPSHGFADPHPGSPTSQGAVAGLFGFRNAPSISYAAYSPTFQMLPGAGALGGQFWDGRAADLPTQAQAPMLNPIEMNNASAQAVVTKVKNGPEGLLLQQLYGATIYNNPTAAFNAIVDAISQFERTPEVSPFSSKYDFFLAGKVQLSPAESNGLAIFNGKGLCFACHPSSPSADGTPPLFTNFTYDNLGVPRNPKNPYYNIPKSYNPAGAAFVDTGLQGTTQRADDAGKFLTPTLRNITITPPYFHNGLMANLSDVIAFYNTRDTGAFGPPEISANEDMSSLGNLGLTAQESSDLLAFLGTLVDGYVPPS